MATSQSILLTFIILLILNVFIARGTYHRGIFLTRIYSDGIPTLGEGFPVNFHLSFWKIVNDLIWFCSRIETVLTLKSVVSCRLN